MVSVTAHKTRRDRSSEVGKANDTEKTFLEEVTNESGLKECVGSQQMEPRKT